jgi:glycosyltransferase involved in cell wall biosynthesis
MIKLSIITINKDNVLGLENTIRSVIQQGFYDFEYIVIDGESTDGSIELLNKYSTSIDLIVSEPDGGIYHAMNKGIVRANGEYIQFLNSGDYLAHKNVLSEIFKEDSDAEIIYGNMLKQIPGKKVYRDKNAEGKELGFHNFYKGTLNHSSAFIRRSLYQKFGMYDESLKIVSDWKFYLQVVGLHCEKLEYRDVDVTVFDMHGISNRNKELEEQERRKVIEELIPPGIIKDYEKYWFSLRQIDRINHYPIFRKLFWFIERFLFKYEKWVGNRI